MPNLQSDYLAQSLQIPPHSSFMSTKPTALMNPVDLMATMSRSPRKQTNSHTEHSSNTPSQENFQCSFNESDSTVTVTESHKGNEVRHSSVGAKPSTLASSQVSSDTGHSTIGVAHSPGDLNVSPKNHPTSESKTLSEADSQLTLGVDDDDKSLSVTQSHGGGSNIAVRHPNSESRLSPETNSRSSFDEDDSAIAVSVSASDPNHGQIHSVAKSESETNYLSDVDKRDSIVTMAQTHRDPCNSQVKCSTIKPMKSKAHSRANSQSSFYDEAIQYSDPVTNSGDDTKTHQHSTRSKLDSVSGKGTQQHRSHDRMNKNLTNTSKERKKLVSVSSKCSADLLTDSKLDRSVYSYGSSEEDHSALLKTVAKKSRKQPLPPKTEKKKKVSKRKRQSVTASQVRSDKTSPPCRRTSKVIDEEANSSTVLKSKAEVQYPGYSSEWSSCESVTNEATTDNKGRRESGDCHSGSRSTISTSSWTSSEGDNKKGKTNKVQDGPKGKRQKCGICSDNGQSEYMPGDNSAADSWRVPITEDVCEPVPLAPDSVSDMEVEPSMQTNSNHQQESSSVASQAEVTVIPETQETHNDFDDGEKSKLEDDHEGSPVIPLQNSHKTADRASLNDKGDDAHESTSNVDSKNGKNKMSAIPSAKSTLSDMDSHLAGSDQSENITSEHKRKMLLETIKERNPRYKSSQLRDYASNTESRETDSCLRRKVKLAAKVFGTYRVKKQSNSPPSKGSLTVDEENISIGAETVYALSISDSEFSRPALRKQLSLCLRKRNPKKMSSPVSIDDIVENDVQEGRITGKCVHKQQSELSEDDHSDIALFKHKAKDTDSGVSTTNASEIAQSPSSTNSRLGVEVNDVTKKTKTKQKKRTTREVISISSDSESEAFEPPPFKKRKPCPSFKQQRPRERTKDKKVDSDEVSRTSKHLNVPDSEHCPEKCGDSYAPIDNSVAEHHLMSCDKEGKTSLHDTTTLKTASLTEKASLASQKLKVNYSDNGSKRGDEVCTKTKACNKFVSKLGMVSTETRSNSDTGSSDSSDSDEDEKDTPTKGHFSKRRPIVLSSKFFEPRGRTDSSKVNSSSSGSVSSSDEEVATSSHAIVDRHTSKVVKDGSSLTEKGHVKAVHQANVTTSPKHELKCTLKPSQCGDTTQNYETEDSSSESQDEVDNTKCVQKPIISLQPALRNGVRHTKEPRKESINPAQVHSKKPTSQKNIQSRTSFVHRPSRFLFTSSIVKKNFPKQMHDFVGKQSAKSQDSYESDDSTGKM